MAKGRECGGFVPFHTRKAPNPHRCARSFLQHGEFGDRTVPRGRDASGATETVTLPNIPWGIRRITARVTICLAMQSNPCYKGSLWLGHRPLFDRSGNSETPPLSVSRKLSRRRCCNSRTILTTKSDTVLNSARADISSATGRQSTPNRRGWAMADFPKGSRPKPGINEYEQNRETC